MENALKGENYQIGYKGKSQLYSLSQKNYLKFKNLNRINVNVWNINLKELEMTKLSIKYNILVLLITSIFCN